MFKWRSRLVRKAFQESFTEVEKERKEEKLT